MTDLYTTLGLVGGIALLSIVGLWILFKRTRARHVFPEETWDSFQPEKETDPGAPGPPEGMERIGGGAPDSGFQASDEAEAGGEDDRESAPAPETPGGDVEALAGAAPESTFFANGGASRESAGSPPADSGSAGPRKGPWWETLPATSDTPPRRTVAQLMGIGLGDVPARPESPPESLAESPSAEAETEEEISLASSDIPVPEDILAPDTLETAPPFADGDEAGDAAEVSIGAAEEEPEVVPPGPDEDMSDAIGAPGASVESPLDDAPIPLPEDDSPNFFDVLQSLPDEESAAAGAPAAGAPGEKEEESGAALLSGEETAPAVFSDEAEEEAAAEMTLEAKSPPIQELASDLSAEAAAPDQALAPESGGEGEQPFTMESLAGEAGEDEPAFAAPAEAEAGMGADVEAKIEQEAGPGVFMEEERPPAPAVDESGAAEISPAAEAAAEEEMELSTAPEEAPLILEEAAPAVSEPALPSEEAAPGEEMVLEPEEAVSDEGPLVISPEAAAEEISLGDEAPEDEIVLDLANSSGEEEIELLEDEAVPAAESELTLESEADTPAALEPPGEEEMVLLSEGEEEPLDVFSVMGEPEGAAPQAPPPEEPSPEGFAGEEESSIWGDAEEGPPAAPPAAEAAGVFPSPAPEAAPPGEAASAPPAPSGSPLAQISALIAEICPGDLIYMDAREDVLPEWTKSAAREALSGLEAGESGREKPSAEEHLRLGIAQLFLGQSASAVAQLKGALRRSDRLGPVLNALAVAMHDQGKIDPAISYCRESIREAGSDKTLQNAVQRNLALLYLEKGDAAQAAEFTEAAIEGLGPESALEVKAQLHLRAGQLFRRLGEPEKARHHLYEANLHFQKTRDGILRVRSLVGLAAVQGELGEFEPSLKNLEEAMRISRDSGDKAGEALVLGQMGIAYTSQDQFTRALEHYEQALALHRELGSDKGAAANLSNIGNIHYFRGDLEEARSTYEAALELNRKEGHPVGQATTLSNLGRVFFEQENYAGARTCLSEARDLFREAGAEAQLANVRQIFEEIEQAEKS